jgi:acyl transferase domain-containing protein
MDAQQRLLLEHSAQVLASASTADGKELNVRTSVMVGIGTVDYTAMSAHLGNSLYAASGGRCVH